MARIVPALLLATAAVAAAPSSAAASAAAGPFRLARAYSSSMVLQAEHPSLSGFGLPAGAAVTVTTTDGETATGVVDPHSLEWVVHLAPRNASAPTDSAAIGMTVSSLGQPNITVADVLFGDVWVCSGQSNMEFSVSEAFGAADIIASAGMEGLRLFSTQKNASAHGSPELRDLIDVQTPGGGWVRSSPKDVCGDEYSTDTEAYCGPHCGPSAVDQSFKRPTWGYFSAVCFLHGRALLRETGRPQGLLETSWGGTSIESWSSAAALANCPSDGDGDRIGDTDEEQQQQAAAEAAAEAAAGAAAGAAAEAAEAGAHWAAMVVPLLRVGVRGAIWYQGEANSRSTSSGNLYHCQMKALVSDWRARWRAEGNAKAASSEFPFVIAALAPEGGSASAVTRYSQFGVVAALPAVGLGNLIDLYDAGSPCGSVHVRNKTVVGERLADASLALAYRRGAAVTWNGPVATAIAMNATANTLAVQFADSNGALHPAGSLGFAAVSWNNQTTAPASQNFEVLLNTTASGRLAWVDAPATVANASLGLLHEHAHPGSATITETTATTTVAVVRVHVTAAAGQVVAGLRYAWAETPRGQQLYALGQQLKGQRQGLQERLGFPAVPFVARCDAAVGSCALLLPGAVPDAFAANPSPAPPRPPSPAPTPTPTPAGSNCSLQNNTAVTNAQELEELEVAFLDHAACCSACLRQTTCVAAEMFGSGTHTPPFEHSRCVLYKTPGSLEPASDPWPAARVALLPRRP